MAKRNKGINLFRHVPQANNPVTNFNMSHDVKFDGDFGKLYPIFVQEVLSGDTWRCKANHFSRLAPMIAPVLHEFDVRFHWFYVPMRLLWDDFEDWMTGGKTGTWREDNPDSFPVFNPRDIFQYSVDFIGSVFDFMGFSTSADKVGGSVELNGNNKLPVMPLRGYGLIYDYFFRDQNVQDSIEVPTTSGYSFPSFLYKNATKGIYKVAWDKDYFTSATLSPQRGPQVYIPLGANAPVIPVDSSDAQVFVNGGINNSTGSTVVPVTLSATKDNEGYSRIQANGQNTTLKGYVNNLQVDLSESSGAAVDDVREAFALQRFFERMQVVGSRFSEWLRGIWGTNAGDARLQMPEYLGTWTNPFMINNVSNTTGTQDNPQGGYAGNGMASNYNPEIVKYFSEPGYLYCLYVAMPRNGYQQGLAPIFCRKDWLDFANPYFEHIGEQPIQMKELYFDASKDDSVNSEIFGYQSQYANYKFIASHSHGQFKTSLNFWHANRIFDSKPTLSTEFISYNPDESTDRVFVLENESKFYTLVNFVCSVDRQLSAFSTPRLI